MQQTLSNLQPVLIIFFLMVMYGIENVWPYLRKPQNKSQHDKRNLILVVINFIINGALSLGVVYVLQLTAQNNWGLLNNLPLSGTAKIIAGIFLIDFGSYIFHIGQHKIPLLWRWHRVHHSDPNLNSTSSLRFHPFDTIASQGIWQCIWFPAIGLSMWSYIIYGTIFLPLLIMQHSNFAFPIWFEKYVRYIFSTPGWHKIHHADFQTYTDSHYGDMFTFWDRIFSTWHNVQPNEISYGLENLKKDKDQTIKSLLLLPFKPLK